MSIDNHTLISLSFSLLSHSYTYLSFPLISSSPSCHWDSGFHPQGKTLHSYSGFFLPQVTSLPYKLSLSCLLSFMPRHSHHSRSHSSSTHIPATIGALSRYSSHLSHMNHCSLMCSLLSGCTIQENVCPESINLYSSVTLLSVAP